MVLATQLLKFDCSKCGTQQKESRGCVKKPPMPIRLDGVDLDRCPMRPFFEDPQGYNLIFQQYRWMKDGLLTDPGLILDQAHRFVAYSMVITAAIDRVNEDRRAKQEQEANAQARKGRVQGGGKKPPAGPQWRGKGKAR